MIIIKTNSSSENSPIDLFQSAVKQNATESSLKHQFSSNIHDEILTKTRIETQQEFTDFHKNSISKGVDFTDNEEDSEDDIFVHPPQELNVGDIIQYHEVGRVSCQNPLVTTVVLKINSSYRRDMLNIIDVCVSEMLPNNHDVRKIYSFVNNNLIKVIIPRFLPLCDYNIQNGGVLSHKYTPTTFSNLLKNDIQDGVNRLKNVLSENNHGTDIVINLFGRKCRNSENSNELNFVEDDIVCFPNCTIFKTFEYLTFEERIDLVHGENEFMEQVEKNKEIINFIDHVNTWLIGNTIQFQEYIYKHFQFNENYDNLHSDIIWYFMKCLCHNYIFLSKLHKPIKKIKCRCPLKQPWTCKWSDYFQLSVIIKKVCRVVIDKNFNKFLTHLVDRSKKDMWHQLVSIFISYVGKFVEDD